jgi:hypothetical protein
MSRAILVWRLKYEVHRLHARKKIQNKCLIEIFSSFKYQQQAKIDTHGLK